MTEQTAPVRIPNVRPDAVSGLDHELLTPAAPAPTEASLPEVPEDHTTVDALLGWVHESGEDQLGRALAVLSQEGRDGRVTLVGPLEDTIINSLLDAYPTDGDVEGEVAETEEETAPSDPQPGADEDGFGGDAPEPADPPAEGGDPDVEDPPADS